MLRPNEVALLVALACANVAGVVCRLGGHDSGYIYVAYSRIICSEVVRSRRTRRLVERPEPRGIGVYAALGVGGGNGAVVEMGDWPERFEVGVCKRRIEVEAILLDDKDQTTRREENSGVDGR